MYIDEIRSKYEDLRANIISNNNLNFIEKIRIISGFSKFVSSDFLKNYPLPEFFIINDLKENDPFKIAKERYEAIIKGLKESSRYFKKLLMNIMGFSKIINHWDYNRDQITNLIKYSNIDINSKDNSKDKNIKEIDKKENKEDCGKEDNKKNSEKNNKEDDNNEYKKGNDDEKEKDKEIKELIKLKCPMLSMLTLNQVKEHLLNLLPKFFFKVDKNYSFNALSDGGNRITLFNEYKILYSKFIKKVLN